MAIQPPHKRAPGYQLVKTPAPKQDLKNGGLDYGESNAVGSVSSVPPAVGGPQSALGKNLRSSVDDPVADAILSKGVSLVVASDDDQLRTVSNKMLPPAHGMKRQQDPNFFAKKS